MKKIFFIVLALGLITLGGCTSSTDEINVEFDGLVLTLPNTFTITNSSKLENKQTVNKIIATYIQKKSGFDTNVLIGNADVTPGIGNQDFFEINVKKIQQGLVGYKKLGEGILDFPCSNRKISGFIHMFSISDSVKENPDSVYYILQYYFLHKNNGYVISMASQLNADLEEFKDYITSLHCK